MAIDTVQKRKSVPSVMRVGRPRAIVPSGAFGQADRQQIGWGWAGINAASAAAVVTGWTADGAFVFDDVIDTRGRRVIDATNRILDDGTQYFAIAAAPTPPSVADGKLIDLTTIHRCTVIT